MRASRLHLVAALALVACGEGPSTAPATPDGSEAVEPAVEPAPLDPGAPAAEQAALAACGVVSAQGYCGVTFGMTPDAARAAFPVPLEIYSGGDPASQNDANRCYEMFASAPVQGVSFLVEMNRVGRIDVLSEAAKTADGFGVGTPAEAIKSKFGAAVSEQPNKYEPEISELVVAQGETKFIYEIQDGKVRGWRAGVVPTVDYVEHCG
jgi:hypothetical protein